MIPTLTKLDAVVESCDEISPERLELARTVFALKSRGATQEAITKTLSISRSTVCRLLTEYRIIYAKSLADSPPLHLIAAEIAKLEEVEAALREKAASTDSERLSLGYSRLALDALKVKINLLLESGIFPKEPMKVLSLTHRVDPGSLPTEDLRTDEEVKEDIFKLLRTRRSL